MTVLSAVVPAFRSTRVPPVAAMSEVSIDHSDVSRSRLAWGLGVLVLGVALIVLGLVEVGPALFEVGAGAFLVLLTVSLILGPLIAAPVSRVLAEPFARGGRITGRLAGETRPATPSAPRQRPPH